MLIKFVILRILLKLNILQLIISINIEIWKNFMKRIVGEPFKKPFKSYPDKKNFYHLQVIDLGFQVDPINL